VTGRLATVGDDDPRAIVLESGSVTCGRDAGNQIVLDDVSVSRIHARLDCTDEGVEVSDLGSRNGTFVNGSRIAKALLRPGDELVIGKTTWLFETAGSPPPPTGMLPTLSGAEDMATALREAPLATIVADLSQPSLVLFNQGDTRKILLSGEAVLIGREGNVDVMLDDPGVSRHHARVEAVKDGFELVDLGSRNGTFVAGRRVERRLLRDGDTIVVGSSRFAFKSGHAGLALGASDLADRSTRRPVVIVPGLMGSQLWRGSERVWPNLRALLDPKTLGLPNSEAIEPRGIVDEVVVVPNLIKLDQYNRLGSYLCEALGYEREKDMLEFAYDWRQDVRESARHLGAAIEAWRERTSLARQPITIIAHSLGCLVTRYFVERLGGKNVADRLILMGGPQQGVPQAIPVIVSGPKLLPFGLLAQRLRSTLCTFPSIYQLLPVFPCLREEGGQAIEVLADESWLAEPQRPLLRLASEFRRGLPRRSSVPTVCVFGYGLDTVLGVNIRSAQAGKTRLDVALGLHGDDCIPEMSAVLEGAEIHPVRQHHGSLYTDNDVKMRLALELTRGVRPRTS